MNKRAVGADESEDDDLQRVVATVELLNRLGGSLNENVGILISVRVGMFFTNLSRAYIYQLWDEDPTFPPKVKVGSRTCLSFWGLQRWIRARIQEAEVQPNQASSATPRRRTRRSQ
jgi:predicted DNA-binding transcriptional regulator AlpA